MLSIFCEWTSTRVYAILSAKTLLAFASCVKKQFLKYKGRHFLLTSYNPKAYVPVRLISRLMVILSSPFSSLAAAMAILRVSHLLLRV
mgnify:CR=1 FL=1